MLVPSALRNHFIKITDTRLGEEYALQQSGKIEGSGASISVGKRWGIIDTGVDDIHDYGVGGNRNPHSGQTINDTARKAQPAKSIIARSLCSHPMLKRVQKEVRELEKKSTKKHKN